MSRPMKLEGLQRKPLGCNQAEKTLFYSDPSFKSKFLKIYKAYRVTLDSIFLSFENEGQAGKQKKKKAKLMYEEKKKWKNNGITWKSVNEKRTEYKRPNATTEKHNSSGKDSIIASNMIVNTRVIFRKRF